MLTYITHDAIIGRLYDRREAFLSSPTNQSPLTVQPNTTSPLLPLSSRLAPNLTCFPPALEGRKSIYYHSIQNNHVRARFGILPSSRPPPKRSRNTHLKFPVVVEFHHGLRGGHQHVVVRARGVHRDPQLDPALRQHPRQLLVPARLREHPPIIHVAPAAPRPSAGPPPPSRAVIGLIIARRSCAPSRLTPGRISSNNTGGGGGSAPSFFVAVVDVHRRILLSAIRLAALRLRWGLARGKRPEERRAQRPLPLAGLVEPGHKSVDVAIVLVHHQVFLQRGRAVGHAGSEARLLRPWWCLYCLRFCVAPPAAAAAVSQQSLLSCVAVSVPFSDGVSDEDAPGVSGESVVEAAVAVAAQGEGLVAAEAYCLFDRLLSQPSQLVLEDERGDRKRDERDESKGRTEREYIEGGGRKEERKSS